jgi:predicted Abi (CAAX) family protease
MIIHSYRDFSSKPARYVTIIFLALAVICLLRGFFQRGAVGDAAMLVLYLMYWPASALVGVLLNPLIDFIYQNYNRSGEVYYVCEAANALVIGTLWNYFFVKTLHWFIACLWSRHLESDGDEAEEDER